MADSETLKKQEVQLFARHYQLHLMRAIQASMVMDYTSAVFFSARKAEKEEQTIMPFFTNPANTLTYSALNANVDQAILSVFASQEAYRWTLKDGMRLKVHRDKIAHPYMYRHNKPEHDAHFQSRAFKFHSHRRVLVLLFYLSQINHRLAGLNLSPVTAEVVVTKELYQLADNILTSSYTPEANASLLHAKKLTEFFSKIGLDKVGANYLAHLQGPLEADSDGA